MRGDFMLGPLLALLLTLAACSPEKPPSVPKTTPPPAVIPPAVFQEPAYCDLVSWKYPPYKTPMTDPVFDALADYRPICREYNSKEEIEDSYLVSKHTIDTSQFETARVGLAELIAPRGVLGKLQLIHGIPMWLPILEGESVLDIEMCYSVKDVSPLDAVRAFGRSFACALRNREDFRIDIDRYPDELVGPARISLDTGKVKAREALAQLLAVLPVKCRVKASKMMYEKTTIVGIRIYFYKEGIPLIFPLSAHYEYADETERREQMALDNAARTPWPDCSCE